MIHPESRGRWRSVKTLHCWRPELPALRLCAALAATLIGKNPMALRAAKHAYRRVREMSWDDAEDYLFAKIDQMRFLDPENGRDKGMAQFLDEKSYRPGLGAYRRD